MFLRAALIFYRRFYFFHCLRASPFGILTQSMINSRLIIHHRQSCSIRGRRLAVCFRDPVYRAIVVDLVRSLRYLSPHFAPKSLLQILSYRTVFLYTSHFGKQRHTPISPILPQLYGLLEAIRHLFLFDTVLLA